MEKVVHYRFVYFCIIKKKYENYIMKEFLSLTRVYQIHIIFFVVSQL